MIFSISNRKWLCLLVATGFWFTCLTAASAEPVSREAESVGPAVGDRQTEVWWLGADPHVDYAPRRVRSGYDRHLEDCIEDVNRLAIADYAVILGDFGKEVERFREAMDRLEVKAWHYVTGNHEFVDGRLVIPAEYWAQDALGIRLIFISDEQPGYGGGLSEEQERWMFQQLEAAAEANRPVFLFSHQPPDRSGSWNMWPRLRKRLPDFTIQAWFFAHEHRWAIAEPDEQGFWKIGLAAIYEYTGHDRFVDSHVGHHNGALLMLAADGEQTEVVVRFRDHEQGVWIAADGWNEVSFTVRVPVPSEAATDEL